MLDSRSKTILENKGAANVLIPMIRTAATIGFAIAPCSLGFVIVAVSEQLIRSIMVGDDAEMLMSDLQNRFPNDLLEIDDQYDADLIANVVRLVERPDQPQQSISGRTTVRHCDPHAV